MAVVSKEAEGKGAIPVTNRVLAEAMNAAYGQVTLNHVLRVVWDGGTKFFVATPTVS